MTQHAPAADQVASFQTILNLEIKKRYCDRAVIGGLDKYVRRWAQGNSALLDRPPAGPRLAALLLSPRSYSDKTETERAEWVKELLMALVAVSKGGVAGAANVASKSASTEPVAPASAGDNGFFDEPVLGVKGVGDSIAKKLARLGVRTVGDVLYFFPRRFMDFSRMGKIADLEPGVEQTVLANVWDSRTTMLGRMKSSEAVVGDETGNIRAVWFRQPWVAKQLTTNSRVALSGKVGVFHNVRVLENPQWELVDEKELLHTGRLVPVYPLTQGLFPRQTRVLVNNALGQYLPRVTDFLSGDIRNRCALIDLKAAIAQAHHPADEDEQKAARQRLAFDELFLLQLGALERKREWQDDQPGRRMFIDPASVERFTRALPFELTEAQARSMREICGDMSRDVPMSRLLQGDVGSGKTAVATIALLMAIENGYQCALMAPTEILAEQHFNTIVKLLSAGQHQGLQQGNICSIRGVFPKDLVIALLHGGLGAKDKAFTQRAIGQGEIQLAIGTHALIQKGTSFPNLGLVVIDEQHRFGVLQRTALRQKGFNPHLLVMTATPIPRTLALTLFGDLDISVIDQMPPGRLAVKTRWLGGEDRERAYRFVRKQVQEGRQAFVICPMIEESESLEIKAAVAEYERLSTSVYPDLRLALLHGKMKAGEKEEVMCKFKEGETDILVSTSVVEVGIDVPNATVMLVEAADRFGLAQLHQFRGRVGRGEYQSYCLLLSENPSEYGRERLKAIEEINDGFALAEKDLELRGPGEFFGTRQSGLLDLRMARLSDRHILELARREAQDLYAADPGLRRPQQRLLAAEIARMWRRRVENN